MNVFTALALLFAAGQVTTSPLPSQFQHGDTRPSLPSSLAAPSSALPGNPMGGTFPVEGNGLPASQNPGTFPQPSTALPSNDGLPGSTTLPNNNSLSDQTLQGNPGAPRSTYGNVPDQTLASLAPERTYGWDYDESGELCYIVQLSPDHAKQMLTELELTGEVIYANSTMPRELIGRIRKISVQIGTDRLPRNPSLENLGKVARLDRQEVEAELDSIGPGSMARVEPDGQAMPVQLPGAAPGYRQPNTGAYGQLGDATPAPGNQFLNDARDNTSLPDYDAFGNNRAPAGSTQQQPDYNRGDLMAALPASAQGRGGYQSDLNGGQGTYNSPVTGYPDPPALGGSRRGNTGFGNAPSAPSFGQQPALAGAGDRALDQQNRLNASGGYTNPNYPYSGATTSGSTTPSTMPPPGNQANLAGNVNGIQQPGAYADPRNQQTPDYRVADLGNTPQRLPSTSGDLSDARNISQQLSSSDIERRNRELADARADAKAEALAQAEEEKKADSAALRNQNNLIGLFCVLSLVVNCYLFTLIRKLLTRYRTLLTNVRSQAA